MYEGTVDALGQRPDDRRANMHILFPCVCVSEGIKMRVVEYVIHRRKCSGERTKERQEDYAPASVVECSHLIGRVLLGSDDGGMTH